MKIVMKSCTIIYQSKMSEIIDFCYV